MIVAILVLGEREGEFVLALVHRSGGRYPCQHADGLVGLDVRVVAAEGVLGVLEQQPLA